MVQKKEKKTGLETKKVSMDEIKPKLKQGDEMKPKPGRVSISKKLNQVSPPPSPVTTRHTPVTTALKPSGVRLTRFFLTSKKLTQVAAPPSPVTTALEASDGAGMVDIDSAPEASDRAGMFHIGSAPEGSARAGMFHIGSAPEASDRARMLDEVSDRAGMFEEGAAPAVMLDEDSGRAGMFEEGPAPAVMPDEVSDHEQMLHETSVIRTKTKLEAPDDILQLLHNYFPWETIEDVDDAELYYHRVLHEGIDYDTTADMAKLKDLSSILANEYASCREVCYANEKRAAQPYYELVEKLPSVKNDPSYEDLTTDHEKYMIKRALKQKYQNGQIQTPQPSLCCYLEELRGKVRNIDDDAFTEAGVRLASVDHLLWAVNRQIEVLELVRKKLIYLSKMKD